MDAPKTAKTTTNAVSQKIIFEQPINDPMRICLRLEHLYRQLNHNIEGTTESESRASMQALLKTLNVIDRPDLKSKMTQTLGQLSTSLAQLEQFPQVNQGRLHTTLAKLDKLSLQFHQRGSRIAESLRCNEFLNQVRLQLNNPAGPCNYKSPAYALWLASSAEDRIQDIKNWTQELDHLYSAAHLILKLVRDTSPPQPQIASNGFYQQSLNPTLPCQLVRISLDRSLKVYPEFSVGRHRLVVRFLSPNFSDEGIKASQARKDIEFELSCCRA